MTIRAFCFCSSKIVFTVVFQRWFEKNWSVKHVFSFEKGTRGGSIFAARWQLVVYGSCFFAEERSKGGTSVIHYLQLVLDTMWCSSKEKRPNERYIFT